MSTPKQNFSKLSFFKTYVVPALLLFILPAFSLWFFHRVQADFDGQTLAAFERSVQRDASLTAEQRSRALDFFRRNPASKMLTSKDPRFDAVRSSLTSTVRFYFATFRWMISLSLFSLLSGVGAFIVAGLSVLYSLRSQLAQYYSLSIGWHVLRVFSTIQVLIQGCLAVALSFWVTAYWFEIYVVKLIAIVAVLAIAAAAAVVAAIFKKINDEFVLKGSLVDMRAGSPLRDDLDRICRAVGTAPPDRIIAGIDNNFFVTEHAVTLNGTVHQGRTLYVSLSLLKTLQGSQADAVMAHEMAHFSGNDTLYSKKISPLLNRYQIYLQALYSGGLSLPVFYFMLCFRGLYQVSLSKLSRQREFRADQIAAQTTSPKDVAHALLKIAAYSEYRMKVERELFDAEKLLEKIDISQRVETGFKSFASSLATDEKLTRIETAHPFDSHPPLDQRLNAVGVRLSSDAILEILTETADGRWFRNVEKAEELEQQQWLAYEEEFRQFHERVLAYRYLPDTEAERDLVVKYFPEVTFQGKKKGSLVIDHEKIVYSEWQDPIWFREITKCAGEQSALGHPQIRIDIKREAAAKRTLPLDVFQAGQQAVLDSLNQYYSRHMAMIQYRKEKQEHVEGPTKGS